MIFTGCLPLPGKTLPKSLGGDVIVEGQVLPPLEQGGAVRLPLQGQQSGQQEGGEHSGLAFTTLHIKDEAPITISIHVYRPTGSQSNTK